MHDYRLSLPDQRRILRALAGGATLARAADAAGVSRTAVIRLRQRVIADQWEAWVRRQQSATE